jgi:hypothetical protein
MIGIRDAMIIIKTCGNKLPFMAKPDNDSERTGSLVNLLSVVLPDLHPLRNDGQKKVYSPRKPTLTRCAVL